MTTFADYIHANAENVEYTTLRDFYQQNVEFAEESELHTVKINMLVRLAQLQWKKDDTGDATENFTRAIDQARSLQEYQLAGDVQMTYAELHNADYHKKRNPSAIKARRLYQNALDSYRQAGFDLGAARAYDGIAQSHYYLDEPVLERKALEESRKLYRSVNIDSEQEYSVVMRLAELASSNDQPELQQSLIAEAVSIAENLGRYELAEDRYLQLARLASGRGAPGEVITQLCFAWQAHERRGQLPDNINERLKSKSRRILPDFKVENCP